MMQLALSWIGAAAVGALVVLACGVTVNVLELVGLAPLIGAGLLTFGFCLAAIRGLPVSTTTLTTVVVIIVAIAGPIAFWQLRRHGRSLVAAVEKPTMTATICIVATAGLVLYAFASAWYWPPAGGDALTVWVLKGRNIRDAASIAASGTNAAGLFYPLNLPLQVAALWPALGVEHIQLAFVAYFPGLILVVAGFLSRRLSSTDAWLFTALLASTPVLLGQASTAMSDIPFAFYYVSSAFMLFRALETGSMGAATISGLLLALGAWTRADGLLYMAVNLVVAGVFGAWRTRPLKTVVTAALIPALFYAVWSPWVQFAESQGWGGHFEASGTAALGALARGEVRWDAVATIAGYFQDRWVAWSLWGGLWLVFAASLLNAQAWRPLRALLLVIVLNTGGLLFTYYAWVYYRPDALIWTLDAGFDRMATHFAPLLWCYAALSTKLKLGPTPTRS